MDDTKANGKTIGEVEKLTGIPKRKLKYFIEQKIMRPSRRSEIGYWLYSDEDIRDAKIVSLCRALGYPDETIRTILSASGFQWREELERQIARLTDKKDCVEGQLVLAEFLLYANRDQEFDFAGFDPSASGCLVWEKDVLKWKEETRQDLCRFLYETFSRAETADLLRQISKQRDSVVKRELVKGLCDVLWQRKALPPDQILLAFRLGRVLNGMESLMDQLLEQKGGSRSIVDAIQIYCDHLAENNTVLTVK